MDIAELQAQPREARGSRACRRLRTLGLVPAVLYGHDQPNLLLSVNGIDVEKLLEAHSFIVRVQWNGQEETAQIREVQYDALGDELLHVDFIRISLTERITVSVPVETHGEAPGVEEGGVLAVQQHELEVECLPTAIPERLRVEVGELEIGEVIRVGDLAFPEGVAPVAEPETVIVTVTPPVELEEEEAEGVLEEAMAEPELIGREAEQEEEIGEEPEDEQ